MRQTEWHPHAILEERHPYGNPVYLRWSTMSKDRKKKMVFLGARKSKRDWRHRNGPEHAIYSSREHIITDNDDFDSATRKRRLDTRKNA